MLRVPFCYLVLVSVVQVTNRTGSASELRMSEILSTETECQITSPVSGLSESRSPESPPRLEELQWYLTSRFASWRAAAPRVAARARSHLTLSWAADPFGFLGDQLLYRLEKNDKIPPWRLVYSGGKTTKRIDDLAPRHPHRFRLKVILKAAAVPRLAELAVHHYGDEDSVIQNIEQTIARIEQREQEDNKPKAKTSAEASDSSKGSIELKNDAECLEAGAEEQQKMESVRQVVEAIKLDQRRKRIHGEETNAGGAGAAPAGGGWLESGWSGETWSSTEPDGSSPPCFALAVRRGYHKQVQSMAEERPALLDIINCQSGLTPLAAAITAGELSTVKLLLSLGADVAARSLAGRTPLHLALLAGDTRLAALLLDKGADITARDCNGLRAEHFAVESGSVRALRLVLDRGGNPHVADNNGWTPLFRAVVQGAASSVVCELVSRGSRREVVDAAGLSLRAAAHLLRDNHGRPRASVVRLVEGGAPPPPPPPTAGSALAHFSRVSRTIHHAHQLLRHH